MFIEVNELEGLIINIDTFPKSTDSEWDEIIEKIPCVFMSQSAERLEEFQSAVSYEVLVLEMDIWSGLEDQIVVAMGMLGLQPHQVAFVSCSHNDFKNHVLQLPIGTIWIKENISYEIHGGFLPDFILKDISSIASVTDQKTLGNFTEVFSTFLGTERLSNSGKVHVTTIGKGSEETTLLFAGRHFDRRHRKFTAHQLSHRIYRSRENNSQDKHFSTVIANLCYYAHENLIEIDGIACVPPKPQQRDRLAPLVSGAVNFLNKKKKLQLEDMGCVLRCTKIFPPQRGLNAADRAVNVRGKFSVDPGFDLKGKNIVLFDDVITTGSTVLECVRTLISAGAANVVIITLAAHQFDYTHDLSWDQLECPNCDGHQKLRFNGNGIEMFFGCSNYPTCRKTYTFKNGFKRLNKTNEYMAVADDE